MSRSKGLSAFSANFEPQMASPLDARMLVDTLADLTAAAVWQAADGAVYAYKGMLVSVCNDTEENNGVYRLVDLPLTVADNWIKLGSGSGLAWYPDDDPPAEPEKGDAYYDTVQGKSVVWDGSAWQTIASDGAQGLPGQDGINGITPHIDETTGNWFIGETDTGIPGTGPAGTDGNDGVQGLPGADGTNGVSPHIDETTGKWFIGETDTGIAAQGPAGADGADGTNGVSPHIDAGGNWFIGETDTGIAAQGPAGADGSDGEQGLPGEDGANGITPHVDVGGNWFIGETDTGIKAEGVDGADGTNGTDGTDGITPTIDPTTKNWFIGETDTGIKAEGVTYTAGDGIAIANEVVSIDVTGATTGQVLKKTEEGVGWANDETGTAVLPTVTVADNDKVLTVVNGAWTKADPGSPYAIESLHALPEAIVGNLGKTVFYTGPTENGLYKNSFYVLEAVGAEPTITYEWIAYGVANSSISIKQAILTLPPEDPPNPVLIDVQGNIQDIDDENNADNVIATHYRIDFSGYVLSMENYESEEAALTDRYYGKMSYNSDNNITNIFMTVEEYTVMSSFTAGKNILKINYLENPEVSIGNTVSDGASTLPVVTVADNDKVLTVVNGNWETSSVPIKGEETLDQLTGADVTVAPWTQSKWSASGVCSLTASGWAESGRQTAYIIITLAAGATLSIIDTEEVAENDALIAAGVYECFLKNVDGKIYFHQISFTEAI